MSNNTAAGRSMPQQHIHRFGPQGTQYILNNKTQNNADAKAYQTIIIPTRRRRARDPTIRSYSSASKPLLADEYVFQIGTGSQPGKHYSDATVHSQCEWTMRIWRMPSCMCGFAEGTGSIVLSDPCRFGLPGRQRREPQEKQYNTNEVGNLHVFKHRCVLRIKFLMLGNIVVY